MDRTVEHIFAELVREQKKLKTMPLCSPHIMKQSIVVDNLINEYYRALAAEKKVAV